MLDAQPPERFSVKFIENLGFTSTNDSLFIGILKDLGFLNRDGAPQPRYFEFLDRSQSKLVVAVGVREAFGDLFAINLRANELGPDEVKNKLRTLYAGKKTEVVIDRVAKTFRALCEYADFSTPPSNAQLVSSTEHIPNQSSPSPTQNEPPTSADRLKPAHGKLTVSGLQYHINIVLPDSQDQAVYDAIFKSLRERDERPLTITRSYIAAYSRRQHSTVLGDGKEITLGLNRRGNFRSHSPLTS